MIIFLTIFNSSITHKLKPLFKTLQSQTFLKAFEGDLDAFDLTIKSIFDFEIEIVIRECVQLFGNHLFTSHLLELLYLSGKLEFNKKPSFDEQQEFMHERHVNEYAQELLECDASSLSLFQIACDYLLTCKSIDPKGVQVIETYMQRIPLTDISELNARRLFVMAYQLGLHDLAFSIGRVLQVRSLKRGLFGDALAWNCRIKDACFGNFLAEKFVCFSS